MNQSKLITYCFSLLLALALPVSALGVTFSFDARSISRGPLRTTMENNINSLLQEINRAESSRSSLNLASIKMSAPGKTRLDNLWTNCGRFKCADETNVKRCMEVYSGGFQVRGIPVYISAPNQAYVDSRNRELCISLDRRGNISSVRFASVLEEDVAHNMSNSPTPVEDESRRQEILKWVEDYRCYYIEKDLNALNMVYSDDALIITATVMEPSKIKNEITTQLQPSVITKVHSKASYLARLKEHFKKPIDVKFDKISITKHSTRENLFLVNLHQTWKCGAYHDEGWLSLLWDFTDRERPQIHVRAWQQDNVVNTNGVIDFNSFVIN